MNFFLTTNIDFLFCDPFVYHEYLADRKLKRKQQCISGFSWCVQDTLMIWALKILSVNNCR